MSGIHAAILTRLQTHLEAHLNDGLQPGDPAWVRLVKSGPLQGDPDPDEARIFITLFENDPDAFIQGAVTQLQGPWADSIEEAEIGTVEDHPVQTWNRRFVVKARLLLESTRENESEARTLASAVRTRIEHLLPQASFSGINVDGEYVSMRIVAAEMHGEMLEAGGPPDSYDFLLKIRFTLRTTTGSL